MGFKMHHGVLLTKKVIYRPKTGFGDPLRYWLKNELEQLVDEFLSEHNLLKRGIFNPIEVRRLIEQNR